MDGSIVMFEKTVSWEVYSLFDPRNLRARYVGVTTRGEKLRYAGHIGSAIREKSYLSHWIKSLLLLGRKPIYLVIEYGTGDGWHERERFWIATHRKFCNLVNATDGGQGMLGHRHSPEALAKMSLAKLGHVMSPEAKEKIALARLGCKQLPETKAKISLKLMRHLHSPETKKKLSLVGMGNKVSNKTRQKISISLKKFHQSLKTKDTMEKENYWLDMLKVALNKKEQFMCILKTLYHVRGIYCLECLQAIPLKDNISHNNGHMCGANRINSLISNLELEQKKRNYDKPI